MSKYNNLTLYLKSLKKDIYPQPVDVKHSDWAQEMIDLLPDFPHGSTVLDVGCGQAFVQPMFEKRGFEYYGVTLGRDARIASVKFMRNVLEMDFHFLKFVDNTFDLVFSRHSLEHSPMPLIALMEWHRVTRIGGMLALVLPNPEYWGWAGRNHYSVLHINQAKFLIERAGWSIITAEVTELEYRIIAKKEDK